jgi:hypothetical protein
MQVLLAGLIALGPFVAWVLILSTVIPLAGITATLA